MSSTVHCRTISLRKVIAMSMTKEQYFELIRVRALSIASLSTDYEDKPETVSLIRGDVEAIDVYLNGLDLLEEAA